MRKKSGRKREDYGGSPHGRNLVGPDVDKRSLLQEGGADHQSMVIHPSYELATEAYKRTSYHFNPFAFS